MSKTKTKKTNDVITLERIRDPFEHYSHIIRVHCKHNDKEYSSNALRVNPAIFRGAFEHLRESMLDYIKNSPEIKLAQMKISKN